MVRRASPVVQVLLATLVLICVATGAAGQGRAEGTIAGTVSDETTGVLPGVTVVATNTATGLMRTAVTDDRGAFALPGLPPGSYEVTAELQGFTRFRQLVTVTVGSENRIVIPLRVASIAETVTVTGEAPLVEVTRTEQSSTITENEVRNLPINSRSFTDFAVLAPGVVPARTGGAGPGAGGGGFSTSGQRGGENAMNIDGMANKSYDNNSEAGNFSQEAVQEFQVLTQSYPAEFGHAAGGVVNAVTKSGANQFNGYAFMFLRNDAFDRPPYDVVTGSDGVVTARSADQAREFMRRILGLTAGGPIKQNRAFFFGVIDHTYNNTPRVRTIADSTLDIVRQVIPHLPDNASNKVGQHKPTSLKSSFKVDVNLSQRQTASFRFSTARNFTPAGTGNGRSSMTLGAQAENNFYLASGSLSSVLSDRFLNTFRFNYSRADNQNTYPHRGGIENFLNMDPGIIIGGGSGGNFGAGASAAISPRLVEGKYELQDTISIYRNRHDMKMGAYLQIVPFYQSFMFYVLGEWQFSDLNAFIAGRPTQFRQSFGPAATSMATQMWAGFVQDEWRVSDKLTMNLGLRYELNKRPDVTDFELAYPAFNPDSGRFEIERNGSQYIGKFRHDATNFMPRVGLSYTPDAGKTVLRGGGGIFYGVQEMSAIAQAVQWTGSNYGQYVFPSADALPIWQGLRNPASPLYNKGLLRLSPQTLNQFRAQGRPVTQQTYPSYVREPRSYQGSAGIERQFNSWLAAQGTFLWSRGDHNVRNANINLRAPIFFAAGSTLPSGTVTPYDVHFAGGARPDPTREEFNSYVLVGTMKYLGFATALQARWPGLQLRTTWSRNLSRDDSISTNSRLQPAFQLDPSCGNFGGDCEWSESVLSTRHRVTMSAVYQTPQQWPIYARGWQLGAIGAIESGHPFVVQSGFDFNNDVVLTDRPLGVPRTGLWTDGFTNLDLRVARFINLDGSGRRRLEVIFEAFNALNAASYSSYVDSLYVFRGGRYVPRDDFAAFHNSGALNQRDLDREASDIGLDHKVRRSEVGNPFQGQFALRIHF